MDLTRSPAGGFGTAVLARLGHRVIRPRIPDSELDQLIYHRDKERCAPSDLATRLRESDVLIVDEWDPDLVGSIEREHLPRLRITLRDIDAGSDRRVTGFVLDHALGFSEEMPGGNAYNTDYEGPPLALPGRLTDHDIGVQLAIAALAWLGHEGAVDVSAVRAAATTHRYQLAVADVEQEYFVGRNARAGLPFGGVLECLDGHIELVIFTLPSWRAVASWMGNPGWTRHAEFPNKDYLDANADVYQSHILEWARTQRVDDILALAARDAVPAGKYVTVVEALADPYWLQEGYSERCTDRDIVLPRLPFVGVEIGESPAIEAPIESGPRLFKPLEGKLVVDFTVAQAGAHAAWVLTQLGATVIKVENRNKPDIARLWTPGNLDTSFAFLEPNAGKKSFLLQWDTEAGHELLLKLIERADLFLTNVRPAVLEKIGLTPDVLRQANPGLILSTISTDGIGDPVRAQKPGWAYTFGAASGVGRAVTGTGHPPSEVSGWADYAAGNLSALAALHTLWTRAAGEFVHVDTNATAALSFLLSDTAAVLQSAAEDSARRRLLDLEEGVVAVDDTPRTRSTGDAPPSSTTEDLHGAGWAAAPVLRIEEVFRGESELDLDPYWHLDEHVVLGRRRRTIRPPWSVDGEPVASMADAPWLGEHTAEVALQILDLLESDVDQAQSAGVLG